VIADIEDKIESVFLFPATLVVMKSPGYISTILGSCISVCLFDKINKTGGINHFMLPFWNGDGLPTPKYGNIAIEKLVEKMIHIGSKKENLIAKVFGGGNMIKSQTGSFSIGKNNANLAFEMLRDLKIPVLSHSTGGIHARKIVFNSFTGEVIHRYVISSKN
jgi:chemotaxis protein CheD